MLSESQCSNLQNEDEVASSPSGLLEYLHMKPLTPKSPHLECLVTEKRGCVWSRVSWMGCAASHGRRGGRQDMDELCLERRSIPMVRGMAQASQEVSAFRWRRSELWADQTSVLRADYLLLLGHPMMGSHHLTRQLISVL